MALQFIWHVWNIIWCLYILKGSVSSIIFLFHNCLVLASRVTEEKEDKIWLVCWVPVFIFLPLLVLDCFFPCVHAGQVAEFSFNSSYCTFLSCFFVSPTCFPRAWVASSAVIAILAQDQLLFSIVNLPCITYSKFNILLSTSKEAFWGYSFR